MSYTNDSVPAATLLCRPPIGWGSTYCFTDVSFGVRVLVRVSVTPNT